MPETSRPIYHAPSSDSVRSIIYSLIIGVYCVTSLSIS